MIRSLKRSTYTVASRIGLCTAVARSAWRRKRLAILCYHGISLNDEHRWRPGLYVAPEIFERRLALLARHGCAVLPLAEAIERLYRNALPDRAVALTFDDGYYDFLARAWPLLRRYGYPATVYLTTARVEHNFPVVNLILSYMLWRARVREFDGCGIPGLEGTYVLAMPADRQRIAVQVSAAIQRIGMTATAKDDVARLLASRLGLDHGRLAAERFLTLLRPEEVRRLVAEGLDVQLHTHLHRTPDDAAAFVRDVIRNRDRIEAMTGRRAAHLCYPSGQYRISYLEPLRREGILSATTCDPGMAANGVDPLLLPRFIDTNDTTEDEFEAWITGLASCLPRRSRRPRAPRAH